VQNVPDKADQVFEETQGEAQKFTLRKLHWRAGELYAG
jgi:hypothetical protein